MSKLELWQFAFSHFNEKARWALDYKRVPHERRTLLPGFHGAPVKKLTGQTAVPVLVIDGSPVFDSSRIIETLEQKYPDPPLYPADETQRRRALDLEDFFDEELGPYDRQLLFYLLLPHPDFIAECFTAESGLTARMALRASMPVLAARMKRMMNLDAPHAEIAKAKTLAALKRLESELQPSGYLVGNSFSVADLTAAALFSPFVLPPEFPYVPRTRIPEPMERLREELQERKGYKWVCEVYRNHRGTSSATEYQR